VSNGGGIQPLDSENRTSCLINSESVALGKQSEDTFGSGDGSSYVTTLNTASFGDKFSDVITLTNAAEGRVIYMRGYRKEARVLPADCHLFAFGRYESLESRDTLIGLSCSAN
jgi:hypothetical protein